MTAFEHDQHIPIDDLSAYADGEALSATERAEIEAHLAVCETCREELESLRVISTLLADLPEPEAPRSFRLSEEDVASASSPEPISIVPWIVRRQSTFRVAAMAAALLLALVVTIDLLPGDTNETAQDDADSPVSMMEEAAPESDDAAPDSGTMDADQEEEAAEESDEQAAMGADEDAAMPEEEASGSGELADGEESDDASESAGDEQVESEEEGDVADAPEEESAQDESEAADEEALEAQDDTATDGSNTEDDVEQQEAAEPPEDEAADDTAAELESGADRDAEPADEIIPAEEPDDGISGLRILAIVLAILTVILLIAGFAIPRWWSSLSNSSAF